jgi:uncharacterized protein DUF222
VSVVASSVVGMRELDLEAIIASGGAAARALPPVAEVRAWTAQLAGSGRALEDPERIDLLRALEELKCAAEGAQAEVTADFDASQRAQAARRGEPVERQGRGIGHQVALARRISPHRGQRQVGLARSLRDQLPDTLALLRAGRITEWQATLVQRETSCLSADHRRAVDRRIARALETVDAISDRELVGDLHGLVYRLDPASVAERRRRAEADRHTTLRPAPDTMTWFGALLPVKDGVAVHKALLDEAARHKARGDTRSRGAIMADTLVRRVLAPHLPTATGPAELPLMINVVLPDTVLLGDDDGTGWVEDHDEVPGDLLREWIAGDADPEAGQRVQHWVRRLYQSPATGELVTMDRKGRQFDSDLAEFIRLRDRRCRTSGCGARIRHIDHARAHADGGPTSAANGQGTCEACNYAKEAFGWSARPRPGPHHVIITHTPTGHRYYSFAPARRTRLAMDIYTGSASSISPVARPRLHTTGALRG